ncbi:MAG: hypothetical protein CMB58_000405 [Methanobacteriota archaeon]|nr:MAG: hypothetical protein CMB58_000405 [Euryarchaeota archaeon]|tara:strand:+ start:17008 stop:17934 length:927 start_codon:yes stop_codon:yes gene_type:complete
MKETKIVELVIADDSQELAIDAISLVNSPAIEQDFVFFGKEKNNLTFAKVDEEKRMLVSPALIPNKQIFRYDPNTDSEYYVYFSPDTVRKASELYLKHNNHHKATYEHKDRVSGVLTVESWIKEGDNDKSKMFGYDLPNGTWFVKMKIENDELWNKIKEGELKGLSIEGYFANKFEQMNKKQPTTEQILSALNEIIQESKKTELKAEKVELGLVDDIEKLHKEASKLSSEANGSGLSAVRKAIQKADKDFTQLSRKSEDGIDKAEKFIKAAKELGVDSKQVQGYLNNFKSWENDADYWIKQLNADQYN